MVHLIKCFGSCSSVLVHLIKCFDVCKSVVVHVTVLWFILIKEAGYVLLLFI